MLSAWSVSDPYVHEPGGASFGWRRLLSGVGVLGIGAVAVLGSGPGLLAVIPAEEPPVPALQQMWGLPSPQLVDRAVYGTVSPPAGLVELPVRSYQDLDAEDEVPQYLLDLPHFSRLGVENPPGYIGSAPEKGFSGVGPADLIVNVRGPVLCIPREAVVIETETTVQIAIYYGLPDPKAGSGDDDTAPPAPDHIAGCRADDPVTGSVLIPITLAAELGDRTVQALDGSEIRRVDVVE